MNKATPHYDPRDERYEEEAAYVSQVARRQAAQARFIEARTGNKA
jgi:hypothetical protein